MYEVVPLDRSLTEGKFKLIGPTQVEVEVHLSLAEMRTQIMINGVSYHVIHKLGIRLSHLMVKNGEEVFSAKARSFAHCSFVVRSCDQQYLFKSTLANPRSFQLYRKGKRLGTVEPTFPLLTQAFIDIPQEYPIELLVFLFTIAAYEWLSRPLQL